MPWRVHPFAYRDLAGDDTLTRHGTPHEQFLVEPDHAESRCRIQAHQALDFTGTVLTQRCWPPLAAVISIHPASERASRMPDKLSSAGTAVVRPLGVATDAESAGPVPAGRLRVLVPFRFRRWGGDDAVSMPWRAARRAWRDGREPTGSVRGRRGVGAWAFSRGWTGSTVDATRCTIDRWSERGRRR